MSARNKYNICYLTETSEGELAQSASEISIGDRNEDLFNEMENKIPLHQLNGTNGKSETEHTTEVGSVDDNTFNNNSDRMSALSTARSCFSENILKLRRKYSLDASTAKLPFTSRLPHNKKTGQTLSPRKSVPISSSSSSSSLALIENDASGCAVPKSLKSRTPRSSLGGLKLQNSNDSDTMQETAESSTNTNQEFEPVWDVWEEPLYETGNDYTEEEKLDPSSLIGDWEGSLDDDVTVLDQLAAEDEFDWNDESDREDIISVINDSKMQLKFISKVLEELQSDDQKVSRCDYIESCATCRTNIDCLENLLQAFIASGSGQNSKHEYITSMKAVLQGWHNILVSLEKANHPEMMPKEPKVKRRLKRGKLVKQQQGRENEARTKISLSNVEQNEHILFSTEQIEILTHGINDDLHRNISSNHVDSCDKKKEEVDSPQSSDDGKTEWESKLVAGLFFGLLLSLILGKAAYSFFFGEKSSPTRKMI